MARSKYGAKPTTVDGIRFASKAEARRYSELRMLERAGEIVKLELQPKFPLMHAGKKLATYIADFRYVVPGYRPLTDREVVEDVKGMKTPVYRLKKKMVEAQYGIEITEVA